METSIGSLVVCGVVLFTVFSIFCITSFSPGGYFLVIGQRGCAAGWGRVLTVLTAGLTIMGLHFH